MPFKQRKPFFLVWSPHHCYTKYRHKTVESAEKEAQRLADLFPDRKFHVLLSLGRCTADPSIVKEEELQAENKEALIDDESN